MNLFTQRFNRILFFCTRISSISIPFLSKMTSTTLFQVKPSGKNFLRNLRAASCLAFCLLKSAASTCIPSSSIPALQCQICLYVAWSLVSQHFEFLIIDPPSGHFYCKALRMASGVALMVKFFFLLSSSGSSIFASVPSKIILSASLEQCASLSSNPKETIEL